MKILFIFIDGVGIGEFDHSKNPFAAKEVKIFNNFIGENYPKALPFEGIVKPVDACLGVGGIPQSATGQTSLYTGLNAAKLLGHHLSGFPNSRLRAILSERSILKAYYERNKTAAFINVYRPIFFEKGPEILLRYLSVTSIMNWKANLKFFSFDDLIHEKAIYHDFTNHDLVRKGFAVPEFSPQKAGTILAKESQNYEFCLYEYFNSDKIGHTQNFQLSKQLILNFEIFLISLLEKINLQNSIVILTSDHGNIEDLSTRTHTRNMVPFMVWGIEKDRIIGNISSIQDIYDILLDFLQKELSTK